MRSNSVVTPDISVRDSQGAANHSLRTIALSFKISYEYNLCVLIIVIFCKDIFKHSRFLLFYLLKTTFIL